MNKDETILQLLADAIRSFFFGEDMMLWQEAAATDAEFRIACFGPHALD